MRWSVRKLFNGVGDCGHMCLEVVLSKLGPKLLCHSPGLFHSFQPRAHSSGQGTVALDSTREGQPCDFNQAKTPVSELFCIFPFRGNTFLQTYFILSGISQQMLRPDFEMKSMFLFHVTISWTGITCMEGGWLRWNVYEG